MSEATAPLIPNFSNMEVNFQAQAMANSPLGKEPPLPIEYKASWATANLNIFKKR
jgi:hypothetical protein